MTDTSLETADKAADEARKRLTGTATQLRARLKPAALVEEGKEVAASRAVAVIADVKDAAAKRPALIIGGAAALATGAVLLVGRAMRRAPKPVVATGVTKPRRKITVTQVVNAAVFVARIASEVRKVQAKRRLK